MGKSREQHRRRDARPPPAAYPPSPSSTSSSDFEFTVSLSPTSRRTGAGRDLCPADELFYKGQLLPLHPSPRISMVRSLLLQASSSSCSSCSDTTASRDSSGSDSTLSGFSTESLVLGSGGGECDSSRPSSVTEEEEADAGRVVVVHGGSSHLPRHKYYSLASLASRFSSVFHRNKKVDPGHHHHQQQQQQNQEDHHVSAVPAQEVGNGDEAASAAATHPKTSGRKGKPGGAHPKTTGAASASGSSAKEVFRKYVKKVKPLYEKLDQKLSALQQHRSQHQQQQQQKAAAARQELRKKTFSFSVRRGDKSAMERIIMSASASRKEKGGQMAEEEEEEPGRGSDGGAPIYAHGSFSGNLRCLQRRQSAADAAAAAASCPSSMRSSPSHSGLLYPRQRGPATAAAPVTCRFPPSSWSSSSSMEELHSAIQGAIAHCKSTMAAGQPNQREPSTAVSEQSSVYVPTESPAAITAAAT